MLANERAGGECEALRNKRPLMLDCTGFPVNLEIREKGGEFGVLLPIPEMGVYFANGGTPHERLVVAQR